MTSVLPFLHPFLSVGDDGKRKEEGRGEEEEGFTDEEEDGAGSRALLQVKARGSSGKNEGEEGRKRG